ncbi:carbon-nitrogen hydrolase family protein [Actinoplanes sp. NEAU-A12]|uniref:Carbon-nitrogen hydrolase family protein n=1 Tax=Actinoplanes sandaracinus TaxID=3045177 RepID=A0ABT6WYR6_9ACTN|nr:carbon-nitrogen hydrolase family protein [Actinoplanes sandaracinus]MDI6104751.1 carbon-nitrogen hydrolase family protein [Actinoplanes sandaracinus]
MQLSILIAQVPTVGDVATNLATLRDVLDESRPGDVVVTPEGLLSGYGEDLTGMDPAEVHEAVGTAADLAVRKQVHLFLGSLLPTATGWCNAALSLPPAGEPWIYRKINLAMNERGPLEPGDRLETVPVGGTTAGVQLCREIRFPEQWQYLATAGARFFVYMTNAANPDEPEDAWRSHLISRAAENQRFVLAANIAHPDQHCPSMVVSPRGAVLAELEPGVTAVLRHTIDVTESGDWYLGQRRRDVVSLAYHGPATI